MNVKGVREFAARRGESIVVEVDERTVDVHVRRVRIALGQLGCEDRLQPVRSAGYCLTHSLERC